MFNYLNCFKIKFLNKIVALCSILLSFSLINGMDKPTKPKDVQLFQYGRNFPRLFHEDLPGEINAEIFGILILNLPDTRKDAALYIHHLSLTCKSMNIFINENTLPLIKKLSNRFSCSNEFIARDLQTQVASEILLKQLGFSAICGNSRYSHISQKDALHIKKNNIDLNFTYGLHAHTQLIFSSMATSESLKLGQPQIVAWLIKKGADINIVDAMGRPAILHALDTQHNQGEKQLIEYFLDHPSLDINRIYGEYGTLLFSVACHHSLKYKRKYKLDLIRKLCAQGANPKIAFKETTLLQLEQTDPEIFKILQDAMQAQKQKLIQ